MYCTVKKAYVTLARAAKVIYFLSEYFYFSIVFGECSIFVTGIFVHFSKGVGMLRV